jgi:hypothetical protein
VNRLPPDDDDPIWSFPIDRTSDLIEAFQIWQEWGDQTNVGTFVPVSGGIPHHEATKKQISKTMTGRKRDPEIHRKAWETRRRTTDVSASAKKSQETLRLKRASK